jgi:hypothetical protein
MKLLMIAGILLTLYISVLMVACNTEKPVCEFQEGDVVQTVVGGHVGQITHSWAQCDSYTVRFTGVSIFTDTHLLSDDGALHTQPFFTEYMKPYELRRVQ